MRIPRLTILPLLTVAVLFITSGPAMAGTFVSDICIQLSSTVFAGDKLNLRLGTTNIGGNHFQFNGVIQFVPAGAPPSAQADSASGSADIRPNGDIVISINDTAQPTSLAPGSGFSDGISILIPATGTGSFFDNFMINDPGNPTAIPPVSPFHGVSFDEGTAAIVSCTGFPI